jgi:hypothetical protein
MVVQVVVFLLNDISELVLGACCLPFYEHVGTTCVCMYEGCVMGVFLSFFVVKCTLLFAVSISFLRFEAYFCHCPVVHPVFIDEGSGPSYGGITIPTLTEEMLLKACSEAGVADQPLGYLPSG